MSAPPGTPTRSLSVVLIVLALAGSCRTGTQIYGFDVLSLPGETITLKAKLEGCGLWYFRRDLAHRPVIFAESHGTWRHQVATDSDGLAVVSYQAPLEEGLYRIRLETLGAGGELLVLVAKADAPLVVTDLDLTLIDAGPVEYVLCPTDALAPMPGSQDLLQRLSRRAAIVYLSFRDDALTVESKRWLSSRGFPDGPLFCSDNIDRWLTDDAARFKTQALAALKKTHPNFLFGLGDKTSDAEAYLANDVPAFIVPSQARTDYRKGAVLLDSWADIPE